MSQLRQTLPQIEHCLSIYALLAIRFMREHADARLIVPQPARNDQANCHNLAISVASMNFAPANSVLRIIDEVATDRLN